MGSVPSQGIGSSPVSCVSVCVCFSVCLSLPIVADNGGRTGLETASYEGVRLQPGVWWKLLSANDPVHQPQEYLMLPRSHRQNTQICVTMTSPPSNTTWTSSL